jgi:hypothetical protein
MAEKFLTRTEVASLCRLNPRTLGNLASAGDGPPYVRTGQVRGRALYKEADVLSWLERNARGQAAALSTASDTTGSSAKAKPQRRRKAATSKGA